MKRNLLLVFLLLLMETALVGCFRDATPPPVLSDTETETETMPETESQPMEIESETMVLETEPVTELETEPVTEPEPTAAITVIDGVTYMDGVLIVNKTYALPETFAPGMDTEAYEALCRLFTDAKAAGVPLKVASSYRSFYDQRYIYNGYVSVNGQAAADRFSARPGHSEHQSGLAFDVDNPDSKALMQSFGDTPAGLWLAENCHKYGFIIRYPQGKEHITGYMYEPWHVRYLGVEKAAEVQESGLCLEEYFGITSVYAEE